MDALGQYLVNANLAVAISSSRDALGHLILLQNALDKIGTYRMLAQLPERKSIGAMIEVLKSMSDDIGEILQECQSELGRFISQHGEDHTGEHHA